MICRDLRFAVVVIALLVSVSAQMAATTVIPPTFAELVDNATEIFVGQVVNRESHWVVTPGGRSIVTVVTFAIEETLKGATQGRTTLEFRGGTVGDVTLTVAEMPEFHVGDRDLLFIGDRNAVSPLVGFMHGRFRIRHDVEGGVDRVGTHDGRPLATTAALGRPATISAGDTRGLSLADLHSEIVARLRLSRGGRR